MDILSIFADRLDELLVANNLTPQQLGKEINHNFYDIYHWKSDKCRYMPSITTLIKLADYFSCSIEFLIGREEYNSLKNPMPCPPFQTHFLHIVKKHGTNFYRLAKETSMATNIYYSWTKGESQPRIDSLIKIASALNCTVDYLLGRE